MLPNPSDTNEEGCYSTVVATSEVVPETQHRVTNREHPWTLKEKMLNAAGHPAMCLGVSIFTDWGKAP